jgi:phosphoribosylformylglycinamidine synthase
VQVGDPFMEKLLIECCLELYAAGVVVAIGDLGAAGIACATTELAAAGSAGMAVALDRVPLRDQGLGPASILMSESQERMMAITEPANLADFLAICAKWEVPATVIGEVTDTGRLDVSWHGAQVADLPPETAAEGPLYDRPAARPASQDELASDDPGALVAAMAGASGERLRAELLALIASPAGAAKTWVTEQYDHYVRGNTVLAMPHDSGVLRIDEETFLGVAVATDGNGRYCLLDPYAGAQLALAEAYRNVAASGAVPLAVTNCLNFGSPEDPAVMWQFAESVRGLADGCQFLGVPVTGGNVSFYNQTGAQAIQPTPVIGVLGVLADVRKRLPAGFRAPGETIALLGSTAAEFGGSLWAGLRHGHLGGRPPAVDLAAEQRLAAVLAAGAERELLSSAHDLSDGGLAVALAESCLTGRTGCEVSLPEEAEPFISLFSESAARALVTIRDGARAEFLAVAAEQGVPVFVLGRTGGPALEVAGQFEIGLDDLRAAHEGTLPAIFG